MLVQEKLSPLMVEVQTPFVKDLLKEMDDFTSAEANLNIIQQIYGSAQEVVERMNRRAPNPSQSRRGGVMTIMSTQKEKEFALALRIGEVTGGNPQAENILDRKKIDKYTWFSWSKANLLKENSTLIASRQNQDKKVVDYPVIIPGGAIRFGDLIISFSGYNAEDDESVVLATSVLSGVITAEESLAISHNLGINRYHNDIYYPLIHSSPKISDDDLAQFPVDKLFGSNKFIEIEEDPEKESKFYQLLAAKDYLGLAYLIGLGQGCPVIPKVILERGAKEAAEGYLELALLRGSAIDMVKKNYPQITSAFTRPIKRLAREPVTDQYLNPEKLANSHKVIPAAEKLLSYILPRLIRSFWGEERHLRDSIPGNSIRELTRAFTFLENSLIRGREEGWTAEEVVINFAEKLARHEGNRTKYLRRLLSRGKLQDDNQFVANIHILRTLRNSHSPLWKEYVLLKKQNKLTTLGITDLSI